MCASVFWLCGLTPTGRALNRLGGSTGAGDAEPCKGGVFLQRRLLSASRNPPGRIIFPAENRLVHLLRERLESASGTIIYSGQSIIGRSISGLSLFFFAHFHLLSRLWITWKVQGTVASLESNHVDLVSLRAGTIRHLANHK